MDVILSSMMLLLLLLVEYVVVVESTTVDDSNDVDVVGVKVDDGDVSVEIVECSDDTSGEL